MTPVTDFSETALLRHDKHRVGRVNFSHSRSIDRREMMVFAGLFGFLFRNWGRAMPTFLSRAMQSR
jgi:hypothetical protein